MDQLLQASLGNKRVALLGEKVNGRAVVVGSTAGLSAIVDTDAAFEVHSSDVGDTFFVGTAAGTG